MTLIVIVLSMKMKIVMQKCSFPLNVNCNHNIYQDHRNRIVSLYRAAVLWTIYFLTTTAASLKSCPHCEALHSWLTCCLTGYNLPIRYIGDIRLFWSYLKTFCYRGPFPQHLSRQKKVVDVSLCFVICSLSPLMWMWIKGQPSTFPRDNFYFFIRSALCFYTVYTRYTYTRLSLLGLVCFLHRLGL